QQGAVLEIGPDAKDVASLRARTTPIVARPGFTCGKTPAMIDASECQRIVAKLKDLPTCEKLFADRAAPGTRCGDLERPMCLEDKMDVLAHWSGPVEPKEIENEQSARAKSLLSCICRDPAPPTPAGTSVPTCTTPPADEKPLKD